MKISINKTFFSLLLTFLMISVIQSVCAETVETKTIEIQGVKYSYTIENETVEIKTASPVSNYDIVVPEYIEGFPVKTVEAFATTVKTVVLPDTVTTLGVGAFNWCDEMTSVKLSQNLTTLPERVFTNCKDLKTINIPAGITRIENYAFNYCESLNSISISDNITYIGKGAFYACKTIKSLNFPNGLTYIGENAFFNCISLQEIFIPKSVSSIGKKAFAESVRDDMGTATNFLRYRTYENINYTGTQEEWNKISIGEYNNNLINSNINYSVPTCFVKIKKVQVGTEVNVTPENVGASQIMMSTYKINKLTHLQWTLNPNNSTSFYIPNGTDYDTIKVFVFDDMSSLKPICPLVTRDFNVK